VYWEENLNFDIDEILAENKRHTFGNKNSTSKILKNAKSENKEDKENKENKDKEEDSNLLAKPTLGKFQKQVSFQVKSIYQKFYEMRNEHIYFNIYEYYDQGEEIFLCSTKITIGEIMKRTNRFLFNLLINDKKLGQLKIGRIN